MAVNSASADEARTKTQKRATVIRVLGYMKQYKWQVILVITLMIAASAISVVFPLLIENAVDVQVASENKKGLITVVCIGLGLALLWSAFYIIRVRIMASISNSVVLQVRSEAFAHLQKLSLHYFDSRPTGKILARIIGDITSLKDMLRQLVTTLIPNIFFFIAITVVMFIKNPVFAGAVFVALPVMAGGSFIVFRMAFRFWQEFRQKQSNVNAFAHETFSGIRVVQSFCAEKQMKNSFAQIASQVTKSFTSAVIRVDFIDVVIHASQGIGYFLLYLMAVRTNATVGALLAFTTYISLFWQPIRQLANMYNQLGNQIAGAERVFEILDTEPTLLESEHPVSMPSVRGDVQFSHVSFAYPDEPQTMVLNDVSFKASEGETIALVGPTGAGKTTIINLLARFYDPVSGIIMIDGTPLSSIAIPDLRRHIGVMTQDSYLFSGTIRDNLCYGKLDATDDEIKSACKAIGADSFILATPKGYDTEVTDQTLSQGQRQLLALARTLLANPSILILDEATSAIDTATELLVQNGIRLLTSGRTSFVVAHRLSTIRNASRILVIDHGSIQESGTHSELLAQGGQYAALYKAQFGI
ncbi:MAG: ABC transporter ATP-binding protein [Sphaerochaetaceae bacterium]